MPVIFLTIPDLLPPVSWLQVFESQDTLIQHEPGLPLTVGNP